MKIIVTGGAGSSGGTTSMVGPRGCMDPDRNVNATTVARRKSKHSRNTNSKTVPPWHDRGAHRHQGGTPWNSKKPSNP
ncbi:MAG: hypothetical protein ABIW84_11205 [Ilumatobacteraceae bacterium]